MGIDKRTRIGILIMSTFFIVAILYQVLSAGGDKTVHRETTSFEWHCLGEKTLKCVFREPGYGRTFVTMHIYNPATEGKEIFSDIEGLEFKGLIQGVDDNWDLITIWQSASAYRVKAFAERNGKVLSILDIGSKSFPQFCNINGKCAVLVTKKEPAGILSEAYVRGKNQFELDKTILKKGQFCREETR
jgi:hypothetical protein